MISFEDALALILSYARPLGTIVRSLHELLGCCTAEDVAAQFDLPRFDNSAVDGFAVRLSDVESATAEYTVRLRLHGIIRAGEIGNVDPGRGACAKIFTGAPLPVWAEAVVMQEFTEERGGEVVIKCGARAGENIRRAAAEFRAGQVVIRKGTRITPPVLGLLAALGYSQARVFELPRVAVIVTGDELITPGSPVGAGQIFDANSFSIAAAVRGLGITDVFVQRARDDRAELQRCLASALDQSDVILTVGGASVGEFDFVKDVLQELNAHIYFSQVAMKPGKPTVFATLDRQEDRKLFFGLPGNPVSALVAFCVFVRPALSQCAGNRHANALRVSAILKTDVHKNADRLEFVRGLLTVEKGHDVVEPTIGQESHMLGGFAAANGLIHFPSAERHLAAGRTVLVELLPWM